MSESGAALDACAFCGSPTPASARRLCDACYWATADALGIEPLAAAALRDTQPSDHHADCMPGWCVLPPSDPRHENHQAHRGAQSDV
jgi:hypothetical protein